MSYYNTTNEKGEALKERKRKANSQYETIRKFFRDHKEERFSPSDIHFNLYLGKRVPLTSVRRAICDLTNDGWLENTGNKVPSAYGAFEYEWQDAKGWVESL